MTYSGAVSCSRFNWFGRFEILKILFVFFLIKKIYSTCSQIKSVQKYVQSVQKTATKSIQISHKLYKKICSTCSHKICSIYSHIKSIQKPVQSIQKSVQSVQYVQTIQICSHINKLHKFHNFIDT